MIYIGETTWRNKHVRFGIKDEDRRFHTYIIGGTGTGKTTLLYNMLMQDISNGQGACLLDPHGDLSDKVLKDIPLRRKDDVHYINPLTDTMSFNPLRSVRYEYEGKAVSDIISIFKKIWFDSWGPRTEYILRNCIYALSDYPAGTLLDINRLLTDKKFLTDVLYYSENDQVKYFWEKEYMSYTARLKAEAIAPLQNKAGVLAENPLIRKVIGVHEGFDFRKAMDTGKIIIANLSKGMLGEDTSSLLGSLIVTEFYLAAISRANVKEDERVNFPLYIDEFHTFNTRSFENILSEARKYRMPLIITHQYMEQLDEETRGAIFGNVGTLISFSVSAEDAEYLSKEFKPVFKEEDLINLPKYNVYLRLMIDGTTSLPFSARTLKHL